MGSTTVILSVGTLLAWIVCSSAMPTTAMVEDTAPTVSSSATPLELFNEVIMGVKVVERLNVSSSDNNAAAQ